MLMCFYTTKLINLAIKYICVKWSYYISGIRKILPRVLIALLKGSLVVLGVESTFFRSEVQHLNKPLS